MRMSAISPGDGLVVGLDLRTTRREPTHGEDDMQSFTLREQMFVPCRTPVRALGHAIGKTVVVKDVAGRIFALASDALMPP